MYFILAKSKNIGYELVTPFTGCKFGFKRKGQVGSQINCANACSEYKTFTFQNDLSCPTGGCACYCITEDCVENNSTHYDRYGITKGESSNTICRVLFVCLETLL